jgi:hypothetical protein
MASHDEITGEIMSAWDEEEETKAEAEPAEESEIEKPDDGEEAEAADDEEKSDDSEAEAEEGDEKEEDGEEKADDGEEEEEDGETVEPSTPSPIDLTDPEIAYFLQKYNGDVEQALRGASQLTHVLGRQGQEKAAAERRVRELEHELSQSRVFGPGTVVLSEEQRGWVGQALDSMQPHAYVQEAIKAGEFTLARAVCEAMADEQPYDAARLANFVDNAEIQHKQMEQEQQAEGVVLDHGALMGVLVQHFPQMPQYEEQMVGTLTALGPEHPLVQDAQSQDPETAARGIIGIYEIARASRASVSEAREKVSEQKRQEADDERREAVVSSGTTAPSRGKTPRDHKLGPGLTLEAMDAAWET